MNDDDDDEVVLHAPPPPPFHSVLNLPRLEGSLPVGLPGCV